RAGLVLHEDAAGVHRRRVPGVPGGSHARGNVVLALAAAAGAPRRRGAHGGGCEAAPGVPPPAPRAGRPPVGGGPAVSDAPQKEGSLRGLLDLDRLVHEPARLAILTVLAEADEVEFRFVEAVTGLTRGNLSSHASRL